MTGKYGVPDDLLPSPASSEPAVAPASQRLGASVPRPAQIDLRDSALAPMAAPEPQVDLELEVPAAKKTTARKAKPAKAEAPPAAGVLRITTLIPEDMVEAIDRDERSRPEVLRHAFSYHAKDVADSYKKVDTAPPVPGMRTTPPRRVSSEANLKTVKFRLHSNEVAAIDEWASKTSLSRSAFISKLIEAALDV